MTPLLQPSDVVDAGDGSRAYSGLRLWVGVSLVGVTAATLLAPAFYGFAAFHAIDARFFRAPVLQHVMLNWLANIIVISSAFRMTGRFDEKLTAVFRRVLVAHGALAFFTLATRHYYSIPMMVGGAMLSTTLGAAVALLWRKLKRPRVGILGPAHAIVDDPWLDCEVIPGPTASIRDYRFLLVTWQGDLPADWANLFSRALLAGKPIRHVAEFLEDARGVVAIEHFEPEHLSEAGFTSYRRIKRGLDVLLTMLGLPVALPILIAAALAIRLTMGAPVLFIQPRVGQGGRIFRMYKLRTMRAAPEGPTMATAPQDSRITSLGRWLRRFRIDELPQFLNVLLGDMSLIGPRPEQPALAEDYSRHTPAFAYRHLVRPGITGWAQVRAPYAANLAETRVKLGYDLFYLKYFSLSLDVQILARTVWTLIGGAGVR